MPSTCNAFAILNVVSIEKQADGSERTKRISLLDGKNGIWLNDWSPSFLNYKGGGQSVDPPMSDGITPVFASWDDIVDVFTISISEKRQNRTIKRLRDLGDMLVKAVQYWTTDWQDEVVYLEAKGAHETQTRYAEIKLWQIPGHSNPYANPFYNITESALGGIILTVTHAPWAAIPPDRPCPDDRSETITFEESGCDPSYLMFDGTTSIVTVTAAASINDIPDFAVAGRGKITVEVYAKADGWGENNEGNPISKNIFAGWRQYIFNTRGFCASVNCAGQIAQSWSGLDDFTPDSEWHHFQFCYDETGADTPAARTIYLSIDGVWITSYAFQQPSIGNYVTDAAANLIVGNVSTGARTWDGDIGWIRVSDRIVYDPAGGDFTPPERCSPPLPTTGTMLLLPHTPGYGPTTEDHSGYGNDGALAFTMWGCDCRYSTAEYPCWPYYLQCNGETGNVNCASGASIDDLPVGTAFTMQAWVRSRSPGEGDEGCIVAKGWTFGTGWAFYVTDDEGLYGRIEYNTQDAESSSGLDEFDPTSDEWTHVLMCYSEAGSGSAVARTIYLAVGGVWVASYPTQNPAIGAFFNDNARNLYIGNRSGDDRTFDGDIGWLKIDSEIVYDPGTNFHPEPRCRLPAIGTNTELQVIYEGAGTITYDRSGNDNTGTITTFTWDCDCDYIDELGVECNCVQASGEQTEWMYGPWALNSALPAAGPDVIVELTLIPGRMLAGDINEIWHTDDGGATPWVASTVPPAITTYAIVEHPGNGHIMAAGGGGVALSTDGGINWAVVNAVRICPIHGLAYRPEDGKFYLVDDNDDTVYSSDDEGATWIPLFTANFLNSIAIIDGVIYAGATTGHVYRSTDGGASWDTFGYTIDGINTMNAPGDGRLYASTLASITNVTLEEISLTTGESGIIWQETGVGVWPWIPTVIYTGSDYWLCTTDGYIYKAKEPTDWKFQHGIGIICEGLEYYSHNGMVYAGVTGNIYRQGDLVDLGRDATCRNDVYVANKSNISNVVQVYVYDASIPTYIDQFPAAVFPFMLFPGAAANNDLLYIGFTNAIVDSGPACSVVFDLKEIPTDGNWSIVWEYYGTTGGPGWVTLNVTDNTDQFRQPGVNSVSWVPPTDWITFNVNGDTLYWIRARLATATAVSDPPIQQHRDIYSVTWPAVDVDDAQVGGDIAALLRIRSYNQSDDDAYSTVDELDLMANRAVVCLRETMRGDRFTSFLNLAQDGVVANTYSQNPIGIVVTDGTGTTTIADNKAPCGIVCEHTTTGNGLTVYDDAAVITFGPSIAKNYYGEFHAYLRAHLYEPSSEEAGGLDDVRVRLKVQTGSGGIVEYTEHVTFTGFDADDGTGNEERYNDFLLLDMGRLKLPVAGTIKSNELPDEFTITVQIASDTGTNLRIKPYDLNLSPADECIADMQDVAFEDDSAVSSGYALDGDSVYFLKPPGIRALVRTADAAQFVKANYEPSIAGQIFLQEDADQKLYFLFARAAKEGEHTGAGNAATLTDDYADFIAAGVRPGLTVYNVDDGSSASITDVTATTIVGTLAGGVDNDWDAGDHYLVVCPNWLSSPSILHSIQLEKKERYLDMRGET